MIISRTTINKFQPLLKTLPFRCVSFDSKAAKSDPYYVLGVSKDDKMNEIKKKYFALAKKYHPDLNPDDERAQKTFLEIQEAYRYIQMDKNPLMKAKFQKEFN